MKQILFIIATTLLCSACGMFGNDFSKVNQQAKDVYAFTQSLTEDGTKIGKLMIDTAEGKVAGGDQARRDLESLRLKCRDKVAELKKPVPQDFAAYASWREVVISYLEWEATAAADTILKAVAASEDEALDASQRKAKLMEILLEINPEELKWKSDVEAATKRLYAAMNGGMTGESQTVTRGVNK